MKRDEKIQHLKSMIESCERNVEKYISNQSSPDDITNRVANEYRKDVIALKYALKAIRLMDELINDEGDHNT